MPEPIEDSPRGIDDPPAPLTLDEVQALMDRARGGEPGADLKLRALLDEHPEVWRQVGDMAKLAENAWVELIGGPDVGLKESVTRKAAELRAELYGASPSPLERLLSDRVIACWMQVHHADAVAAQAKEPSLKQADFASKRQDRAHRRYLSAMGALTAIRRLLPVVEAGSWVPVPGAAAEPIELRVSGAETDGGGPASPRFPVFASQGNVA